MKAKKILMLCLLLGIGVTKLSAQTYVYTWPDAPYYTPVFCDDVLVDELNGTVTWHAVWHCEGDVLIFANITAHGTATGTNGETFKVHEKDMEQTSEGYNIYHVNLKGDNGNHYIGTILFDFSNYPELTFTPLTSNCITN